MMHTILFLLATDAISSASVRLVDGPTEYSGRVEVFIDGDWGTICHSQWNEVDARYTTR